MICIVQGGSVVYGPAQWDRRSITNFLNSHGVSVSLPAGEIDVKLEFGAYTVMPVLYTAVASMDPRVEKFIANDVTIGVGEVSVVQRKEDRDLDTVKVELKDEIDRRAEASRDIYITSGSGQAMVYRQKQAEAEACLADGSPTAEKYPHLNAEIGITAPDTSNLEDDLNAVASVVNAEATAWIAISASIEGDRRGAKVEMEDALTVEEAAAIVDSLSFPGE